MEYGIYKLDFQTGVHFGTGMLNESAMTFYADQLFSALYIEALKQGCADDFMNSVKTGQLLFSDAFPFIGQQYFVPKPMLYVENKREEQGDSIKKKKFKKLLFIPEEELNAFLDGSLEYKDDPLKNIGKFVQQAKGNVRSGEEDTQPFRVGTFNFNEGSGLYVILAYEKVTEKELFEELFEALSYTGIGGEKSSGLGKFVLRTGTLSVDYRRRLDAKTERNMLLSVALPRQEEMELALEEAAYILMKRSGFIDSQTFAPEVQKKRDMYVMGAGSIVRYQFKGDVYDVAPEGKHPVYRYAKPLFLGV